MTQNLFNGTDPGAELDTNRNYFEELVGDGKRFQDPEVLARSKIESDNFIEVLKRENAEVRNELKARQTLEQLADRFNAAPRETVVPSNQPNDEQDSGKPLTPDEIEQRVLKTLETRELNNRLQDNFNYVQDQLVKTLGNTFGTVLKEKLNDLGMTEDAANNLARTQPKAFLALFAVKPATVAAVTPSLFSPSSTVNTAANPRNISGVKDLKHYNELRKKMGTRAFEADTRLQAEIHQNALAMGEDFFK